MKRISGKSRLALGLVLIVSPWLLLQLPGLEYYLDILVFAGIYSLITIGLSLLMGYAGQISLGHAGFFGIGAYTSAILTVHFSWNPWAGMLVGTAVCGGLARVVGKPSLKLRGHYLAMATLALGIIIFIILNEETEWTGGPDGMGGIPGLSIADYKFDTPLKYYYLVWGAVYLAFLYSVNIIQSRSGRAMRAIHSSETAASAVGIDVAKYKMDIFILSAIFASLAGSFYAHFINFVNPGSFSFSFSIKLLIMITIGGFHHIFGAILGAVIVTFLSMEWLTAFEEYELVTYGAILLVFVIFLPDGLVGLPAEIKRLWGRLRSR